MMAASDGTVTLLFTDLVGSTETLDRMGDDAYEELRRAHFGTLRWSLAARGGREVKSTGDGLMVAFPSAVNAVACAVSMQQAVHRYNESQAGEEQLQVRVGLHAGEPIQTDDDYYGMAVVVAERLCNEAMGGQIMISETVRVLVGSRGSYNFRDLGALELKGIAEPMRACEVRWEPSEADDLTIGYAPKEQPPLPATLLVGDHTPFVGREAEREMLDAQWERAQAGDTRLALVTGEPGIGKTRLSRELAAAAYEAGATVLYGRCYEDGLTPGQPFVEALQTAGVPTHSLSSDDDAERLQLVDSVADALCRATGARPLLLILDDLHWADDVTLLLLRHLTRTAEPPWLLMVGTYRTTEMGRQHPLAKALADLRRDRLFERVQLAGLDEGQVTAFVYAWSAHHAPRELSQAIYDRTQGSPFFIEEVLRHLYETKTVYEESGRLSVATSIDQLGIPESVQEVTASRLARLSSDCNSALTIATVIGQEFGIDSLERASDLSSERLAELLEEAVAARLVDEVPQAEGRYRFSHGLTYEALRNELTTTRRVRLHGQTLQYADNDGVKLAYEVLGSSGTFVIAVGLSNCPAVRTRNWATTLRWERVSKSCRVILYDRRGVGFSSTPERGYSLMRGVEDLRAVLDAAGARRVVLWGVTDGGPLAVAFAAHYPERTAALLLLGTTPKYASSDDFPWGVNPAAAASFVGTDSVDRDRAVSQITETRSAAGSGGPVNAIVDVMRRVPEHAWSKIIASIGTADVRSMLSEIRASSLIVTDPGNQYIAEEAAHYLHEHIPGSELVITEEWGKPFLGETLWQRIEDFIQRAATGSTS